MMVSCGDDDDPVIGGEGIQNGTFLTIAGEDPLSSTILSSEVVEAEGFGSQERSGFVGGYMWLEAGSYQVVTRANGAVTGTIGGTLAAVEDGASSDCGHNRIMVVTTEVDGPAWTLGESGFYRVTHDQMVGEMVLYRIMDASVIGPATPGGWAGDTPFTLVDDMDADGFTWEITDLTLRPGEWKVRFNCNWGINRRINPDEMLINSNGYQLFTNFGGAANDLQTGGANINLPMGEDGIYTLRLEWTPRNGFFFESEKTQALDPLTFNSNDFKMAVVGSATADDTWTNDRNLFHSEDPAGVHNWYGVVTLRGEGEYKFRANDAWDFSLGGDLGDLKSENAGNIATPGEGAWYFELTTADQGETWSATVNNLAWSVIGEGSPSGSWDMDTVMESNGFDADGNASYSVTGDFTTGPWKFRAGRDWKCNFGGDMSFLTFNSSDNITLGSDGTYTVTLNFDGEVYSATAQ